MRHDPDLDMSDHALPPARELNIRSETADIIGGAALTALAGWFLVQSAVLPDYSGTAIGAADFPKGLAVMLMLGSVGLAIGAVWRFWAGRSGEPSMIRRPLRVFIGIVLLVAFPLMMEAIGYYPAMAIFLAAFLWLADVERSVLIIACVVGFLLFSKIVFEMILRTPLS